MSRQYRVNNTSVQPVDMIQGYRSRGACGVQDLCPRIFLPRNSSNLKRAAGSQNKKNHMCDNRTSEDVKGDDDDNRSAH